MKVWSAITHIANTSSAIPANVSGLPAKASEVPATHKVLTVQGKESKVEGMNAWSSRDMLYGTRTKVFWSLCNGMTREMYGYFCPPIV